MVVRPARFGPPLSAYQLEEIPVPPIGSGDVLLQVKAAGINYNGVWAASGRPLDVIELRRRKGEEEAFHVGGSDAAGIVAAVGSDVTAWRPGDHVVIDANVWDDDCPEVLSGGDPPLSPTSRVLGYEENWGTFAEYARVRANHLHPKPTGLSWTDAATLVASGGSAWRMLHRFVPHDVKRGDVVLVWGGAGGLGSFAIQIAARAGALPVAIVSNDERAAWCRDLGAVGTINRANLDLAEIHTSSGADYDRFLEDARTLGRAIWDVLGERRNPRIVVEHPGQSTLPTSVYLCARGGMVVTCAGTAGYLGTFDLRHLWIHQKRVQGSHMYDHAEARHLVEAVDRGDIRSCTTRIVPLEDVGKAHTWLADNVAPNGKIAVHVAD